MLYYFPGAPDSYGDNLDDELKELLAQTADRPEHKQIHETLLQPRAACLQLRILAEQAAQQAAHAQQIQKEAERRTAEVQQQSKEVIEAFAKAVRKRRKREVPAKTDLEVIVARSVTIGGAALGDLIGASAKSESGATVDAQSNAGDERSLQFWHPKEGSFPPIAIDVESRAKISVSIPKR